PPHGGPRDPAAQPADRPPERARALRDAGRAACELDAAKPRPPLPGRAPSRRPPPRGRAGLRGPNLPALGAKAREPPRRAYDRLLPQLRHQLLRAGGRADDGRGAGAQRLPRRRPAAGLLRAAPAVERELPR